MPFVPWKPGESGNPAGKPKGTVSPRTRAVQILESVLAQPDVQEAIRVGLHDYFLKKPVQAFRRLVMPLLPRTLKLDSDGPVVVAWKSILDIHRQALDEAATAQRGEPPVIDMVPDTPENLPAAASAPAPTGDPP